MSELELTPDVFTADYVGSPGERTFYIQAVGSGTAISFVLEKQQVGLLADKLKELLLLVDARDPISSAVPERDPGLAMVEVPTPRWRIGSMGLSYDDDVDRIVLFISPVQPEEEADLEQALEEEEAVRLVLRRDQVRGFVLHALAVVSEGRPICQLCGLPIDPAGHKCPASNGHRLNE